MTFDPRLVLLSDQGFFLPNLVAIGDFCAIWSLVDPRWPLHDLWPKQWVTLRSGVLPTKFGGLMAFLKELDLLMTFELLLVHFENMLSNLVGPSPTLMPSFRALAPYLKARRNVQPYIHIDIHPYRGHYLSRGLFFYTNNHQCIYFHCNATITEWFTIS